jgi:hypothetical protein
MAQRADLDRPDDATTVPRTWGQRRAVLVCLAGAVVVMLPACVALVALARPQWYPTGDMAQAELHVRGFWSHPPLVGAAGRIQGTDGTQGSHPGPALWLSMWPLYALGGASSFALQVSVVVVHLVTVALALWLAIRRGGAAFAAILAATLVVVVRAGGPEVLTEPWNPWMGLLPFLVLLLALWSVAVGDWWAAPIAVLAGSASVQAHAGYLLLVTGLCIAGIALAWRRARRQGDGRRALAWGGWALLALVVAWLPPLVDQLRRDPGNLTILRESFGNPDGPYLGLGDVVEVVVVQLSALGPWVFGPGRDTLDAVAVLGFVAFVAVWAAAVRSARRREAHDELALHTLLGVGAALAVVSISRIFGQYFEYTIRWAWILVATIVAASAWSLWAGWRARPERAPGDGRLAVPLAASAVVSVVVIASVQFATRAGPTGAIDSRIVGGLVPQVVDDLDPDERYLLRWWDPAVLGATGFGTVLELERQGFTVGVDEQFAAAALPHRVQPEATASAVLYLVLGDVGIERARATPGLEELGAFDVRSPTGRARSDELRSRIEQALTEAGQADRIELLDAYYGQAQLLLNEPAPPPEVRELLAEYIDLRQPAALFRAAPGTPVLPL